MCVCDMLVTWMLWKMGFGGGGVAWGCTLRMHIVEEGGRGRDG